MSWRGATTIQDRIFAALTYLLPILEILLFGSFLFALIPALRLLFTPIFLLASIYFFPIGNMAIIPFVVFFALFIGVVRNESYSHFLRFHAMQALLLAVFGWILRAFIELLGITSALIPGISANQTGGAALAGAGIMAILLAIIFSVIFIGIVGASIYSVVQSLRGQYAEMPLISEAAHSQLRF